MGENLKFDEIPFRTYAENFKFIKNQVIGIVIPRDENKDLIEQLLVYFISTYFCGAVYDGEAFAKAQMAVVSTLLIHELLMAQWKMNEKALSIKEDRKSVV